MSAVSVLRFQAGEVRLGLAAGSVVAIGAPEAGCAHIGDLLGLGGSGAGERVVGLESGGVRVQFIVDGPVGLDEVGPERVLKPAPALPAHRLGAILGFLRDGERIVILLDVPALVGLVRARAS